MKKYVKPELFFERYELSQHIAACDYDSNHTADNEGCKFTGFNKDFGVQMTIFLTQGYCDVVADSYCYHNAAPESYGIFNS